MKHLLLIHGALGSASQIQRFAASLSGKYSVHTFDLSGHGADSYSGPLSMKLFANDIVRFLDGRQIATCEIFGYSMGGYAAMELAATFPERVSRITTLGTKWHWTPEIADKECAMLNPDVILAKVPAFAEGLERMHSGQGWKNLMKRTAELLRNLGQEGGFDPDKAARIFMPVKIMLGSDDRMVTREESENMAAALPNGAFVALEGVPHPIDKVPAEIVAEQVM